MRLLLCIFAIAGAALLTYSIVLGPKVENLDNFTAIISNDPLFYSPFFEAEAFSVSVRALEESEARLKKTAIINIKKKPAETLNASLLEQYDLFPVQFLNVLAAIPPATDEFLSAPEPEGARRLIALYERAAHGYEEAGREGLAVLERIPSGLPQNRPALYFFVDSATSLDIVKSDYSLIQKNGEALLEEVARRKACLFGKGGCAVSAVTTDTADFLNALQMPRPNFNHEVARFVKDTLPTIYPEQKVRGPYPVSSSCWQGETPHWFYLLHARKDGAPLVLPKLVTQNYYALVSKNAPDELSQAFVEAGYAFYSQPEATTYECTNLTFFPRLLALDFVQTQIDEGLVSGDNLRTDQEFALFAQNQFGTLAPAFNLLAGVTHLLEMSQQASPENTLSPQLLFVARSAYSLTFMPFAKSVWRITEQPTYLLSDEERSRIQAPPQFKTYTELRAYGFTDEQIRESHINQRQFIESLLAS